MLIVQIKLKNVLRLYLFWIAQKTEFENYYLI